MAKRRWTVGLIAFLRGSTDPAVGMPGCANFDHHYGGCLFMDQCLVQESQRCEHFERIVLPTAADIGLSALVYSLYERQCGVSGTDQLKREAMRACPECGGELKPRRRFCDDCAAKRRRQTYRQARRKKTG